MYQRWCGTQGFQTYPPEGGQLGRADGRRDGAKVISRMVDLVMIRTYDVLKLEPVC
jgi:ornithine carbamoyltransferase